MNRRHDKQTLVAAFALVGLLTLLNINDHAPQGTITDSELEAFLQAVLAA